MLKKLEEHRKNLHEIPEMGYAEFETAAYIKSILKPLHCELTEPVSTAICAFFKKPSHENALNDILTPSSAKIKNSLCEVDTSPYEVKTIAFRCDMDALPCNEKSDYPYPSKHKGFMHSCGHDGHMAIMLGFAEEISKNIDKLKENILLIFQPAEEGGGGGSEICKSKILKKYNVSKIYAIHLWPGLIKNVLWAKPGPMLAKTTEMNITVYGKSSHIADEKNGIDALFIGSKLLIALYEMAENEAKKNEFLLLKFGKSESGLIRNSISAKTTLEGTLRCFDPNLFEYMLENIYQISQNFEKEYGCTIQIYYNVGFPAVINDPKLFEESKAVLSKKVNFETLEKPFMQSEDFSFYQQLIPGILFLLGTGDTAPLHSEKFNFDDELLETGVNTFKTLIGL